MKQVEKRKRKRKEQNRKETEHEFTHYVRVMPIRVFYIMAQSYYITIHCITLRKVPYYITMH